MPKARITGLIVSLVWDYGPETRCVIEAGVSKEFGEYVELNHQGDICRFRKESWPLIRDAIDNLFCAMEEEASK